MRIATWNCHDGLERKVAALASLEADLAVVCECRPAALAFLERSGARTLFAGPAQGKGLGIVAAPGWSLETVPIAVPDSWFLPAIARKGSCTLHILAAWVLPARDYVSPTLRALEACADFLANSPSIVAGDLNQNVRWDKGKSRARFAEVIARLDGFGLASAWHDQSGEEHGEETCSTLFHHWNGDKGYHIDYIFAPRLLTWAPSRVEVGTYLDWVAAGLSDHVPLTVELPQFP